eukprot:gene8809-8988_t
MVTANVPEAGPLLPPHLQAFCRLSWEAVTAAGGNVSQLQRDIGNVLMKIHNNSKRYPVRPAAGRSDLREVSDRKQW